MTNWAVFGRAGLLLMAGAHTALAATEPVTGIYSQYQYVTSSSSTPSGLTGCDPVGDIVGGYFHFPGPSKAGAYTTVATAYTTVATDQMRMQICQFPTTPAAGVTSYSGTEACMNTYQSSAPVTYTESFSWVITYVSNSTFLAKKTVTFPVSGGTYTEVRNVGFERTGK